MRGKFQKISDKQKPQLWYAEDTNLEMVELEAGVGGERDADVSPRLRFLGSLPWFLPLGADSLFCGTPGFIIKGFQHSGTTWVVSEWGRAE